MYAVIANGGKQYKVSEGQILKLEQFEADAGNEVEFNEVLLIAEGEKITLGAPLVKGAVVKAEVINHGRGDKIHIIKFRRRKHHMKQMGHRQNYTEVKITGISTGKSK